MEMTLNVRKGGKVEKTYIAETYDLMWGTMEDVLACVDFETISNTNDANSATLLSAVGKMVMGSMGQVKPLLKDIFPGLTDAEIRCVAVKEIATAL
ncbi:MAG: hypothetical protein RR842_10395, partial [Gordonibacter sp.]|uniref:hypothetical protein n=1 Tax=Gordonibacter sp. TaxID=1968902 RepID=UPI002FCAE830